MRVTQSKVVLAAALLVLLLAAVILLALGLGTAEVGLGDVWQWLWGRPGTPNATVILFNLRLPRILLAALVGASLSLCGVVFQGLLRNPLAEPFILGVSGGAATGAVLALACGLTGIYTRSTLAFAGALVTTLMVLTLARRRGALETNTLVLTGVMINAFFTAVIMYVISTTTDQKLHAIMFWLYGDLGGSTLASAGLLAPVVLMGGGLLFLYSRELNLLCAGELAAASLGV
ncbi:MAG: iron ABC transporter permease, partial [Desulfarculaceae bacterium]